MSDFRIAFFDLDDTLVDHTHGVEAALQTLFRRRYDSLANLESSELRRLWGLSFGKYWPEVINGHITLLESRAARLADMLQLLNIPAEQSELYEMAEEYGTLYTENVELIDGVEEVLKLLASRDIEIAIVTNTTDEMAREKLEKTGLGRFVKATVSAEETGKMKPDIEIFRISLQKTGFSREEAVFTGDSIKNDVVGARNAGIAPVWFNRFGMNWTERKYTVPVLRNYDSSERAYSTFRKAIITE